MVVVLIRLSVVLAAVAAAVDVVAADARVSFFNDVRPILNAKCVGCHQPAKQSGSYDLTSHASMSRRGDRDEETLVAGDADASLLLQVVTPHDGAAEMPPEGEPLTEAQVDTLRRWIEQGAIDDSPVDSRPKIDADNPPVYRRPPVVTSIDHSPDGELLAIAGRHEVLLHRADGLGLVARLVGMSERIESVRFSPDGARLAVAGGDPARRGEVQVWDVAARELLLSIPAGYDTARGVSWSPDGELIAFGMADNSVRAVRSDTGEQVLFQGAANDWPLDTTFSVDGSHLVSVGRDMTVKLIEVAEQRFVDNITSITPGALRGGIHAVARHPLRDEVLVGGADGVPRIYRMHRKTKRVIGDDANLLWELPKLAGRIFSVAISRDGSVLAAASSLNGRGMVRLYRMAPEPELPGPIEQLLFKPTHQRSQAERDKLREHFEAGVEAIASIELADAPVFALAISPDNATVTAAAADGVVRVYDATNGEPGASFDVVPVVSDQAGAAGAAASAASGPGESTEGLADEAPPTGEVVALRVAPSVIEITGRNAYTQAVVTAELADQTVVDVTRVVAKSMAGDAAAIDAYGLVTPAASGSSTVRFELNGVSVEAPVTVNLDSAVEGADYLRDVSPVLARAGCNAGTCHGAQDGKNGFKLSLRGYDPLFDVRALTDDLASRRVNLASPDDSLMLLKALAEAPHEGGQAIVPGGRRHAILRSWIEAGARLNPETPRVASLSVSPANPVVERIEDSQQVRVVAQYADGSERDVTQDAFIESGNTDVVAVSDQHNGLVKTLRRGEAALLVRYEGAYASTTVTVMGDREGFAWEPPAENNPIDGFVAKKLQRTKTAAAPLCDDYEFLRRVTLDLTGLPPTADAVRAFAADATPTRQKRDALIDELIGSDAFVEHWTNKWADLLQVNGKFLGRDGAKAFRGWIRERIADNTPHDEFASALLTATGSNRENPPASYYKIVRTAEDRMENTTHLFLATRFNCNKCHDHPFERWTQDQYYELAAFFAQTTLAKDPDGGDKMIGATAVEAGKPLYEVVADAADGEVTHERTGEVTAPAFPFDCDHDAGADATRRERLAAWITSPDNPYFARSHVNRLWGYLFGVGIIEPIDDIRAGNPPSNPELLDYLTQEFVDSGFDNRHVLRLICQSGAYQRSIATDRWNADDQLNFSHAKARRLPAEALYDAIHLVTGARSSIPGLPEGARAATLADASVKLPDGFLDNLGRPARESVCECERVNTLQLGPVMALVSGPTVGGAISDPKNALAELAASDRTDEKLIDELYHRILGRPASEGELEVAMGVFAEVEQDHERLQAAKAKRLEGLQPELGRRELERQQEVIRLEERIAALRAELKPKRDREAAQRKKTLNEANKAIGEREKQLTATIDEWIGSLDEQRDEWTTLQPEELSTTIPGELIPASRGTVRARVETGKGEYRIAGPVSGARVTAVRVEALSDPRFPGGGPGLQPASGNFVLTELQVFVLPADADAEPVAGKLVRPRASFSQGGYNVAAAADGKVNDGNSGWAISPRYGQDHVAVFELEAPLEIPEGGRLEFRLHQHYVDSTHRIGRLRLSYSTAAEPTGLGLPAAIADLVDTPASDRTIAQLKELIAYRKSSDKQLKQLRDKAKAAEKPVTPDERLARIESQLAAARQALAVDQGLRRATLDADLSARQLERLRLTAVQDLAWALINSPAFLYNH